MCNLYSSTKNQDAIRRLFKVDLDRTGNLASMPGVFPDYEAPVIRNHEGQHEMLKMRWGMPPPPKFGGAPITNIRNTSSPHWRGWLKPEHRCLVPASSFSEYAPEPNPVTKKKDVVWFALNDERPLFAFAGIWTTFRGERGTKAKPIPGPHLVYGFLTTEPNAVVEPIHPKAMPVILTPMRRGMFGYGRHGMKRRRCNGRSPMMGSQLLCADPIRKIGPPPKSTRKKTVQP